MSYKPEVMVMGEPGKWHGNGLRFATLQEAQDNARDLARRWTLVIDHRAVESPDPVGYAWVNGELHAVEPAE
jgi:hypothetical protein